MEGVVVGPLGLQLGVDRQRPVEAIAGPLEPRAACIMKYADNLEHQYDVASARAADVQRAAAVSCRAPGSAKCTGTKLAAYTRMRAPMTHCGTLTRQQLAIAAASFLLFAGCESGQAAHGGGSDGGERDQRDAGPPNSGGDQPTDPQVLADHQIAPVALAVSEGSIYWINAGPNKTVDTKVPLPSVAATINTCKASGCPEGPTILVTNRTITLGQRIPLPMVVHDKRVYWQDSTGLASCGTSGCDGAPNGLAKAAGLAMTVVGDRVFMTRFLGNSTDVTSCTLPACADLGLVWNVQGGTGPIAADDDAIVWVPTGFQVMACEPPDCSDQSKLTATSFFVPAIALDSQNIFFVGDIGTLAKCARSNCDSTFTVLAEDLEQAVAIASDGKNVYWAERGWVIWHGQRQYHTGRIRKCSVDGCDNQPSIVADGLEQPTAIAVNGDHVYWVESGTGENDGRVMRVRK